MSMEQKQASFFDLSPENVQAEGQRLLGLIGLEENPTIFISNLLSNWRDVQIIGQGYKEVIKEPQENVPGTILPINKVLEIYPYNDDQLRKIAKKLGSEKVKGKWQINLDDLAEYANGNHRRKPRQKRLHV